MVAYSNVPSLLLNFLYNQTESKVFSYFIITLTKILSIYDTPQLSISVFYSCELFQMSWFWLMRQGSTATLVQVLRLGRGIGKRIV